MGLKGNLGDLRGLKRNLKAMPITMAHDVARRSAPAMTEETQKAFNSNQSVYGETRPLGVDGNPLTLFKTGTVQRLLAFVQTGTLLRAILGPDYSRYLIGKYGILPNGALPAKWSQRLSTIVSESKVEL